MNARYAENTNVDSSASRAEIERTLARYGATSFMVGWEQDRAAIGFVVNDRNFRFILSMPDPKAREVTHTPTGQRRDAAAQKSAHAKLSRQRWRALALVVKAKLEAVAAGIVTFDEEFLAHMLLPNGGTVYSEVLPAVEQAYTTGAVPSLTQLGRGTTGSQP